jgi:DNA-binding transcriptional regulator GbsR (MarR family)
VQKLTEDQHHFIEDMGQHMVGWGIPRNTGRIYAYLLLQDGPASLDQIAADLEVAKSGVSVGARQLVSFGMVRAIGERGSRRVLYAGLYSLEAIFAARSANAVDLQARLRQGAEASPPGSSRERLEEMAEMLQEFIEHAPEVFRQLRERRRA